jgi:hypothetical protein
MRFAMSCRSLIARSDACSAADSLRWYLFALRMFHEATPASIPKLARDIRKTKAKITVIIHFSLKVLLPF